VVRGSEAQREVISWIGTISATIMALGIGLCAVLASATTGQRVAELSIAAACILAAQALLRWHVPAIVQDSMLVAAIIALGFVGALGGPLLPILPMLFVVLGTSYFVIRTLRYSLVHLGMMSISYAAVLVFGPDTAAPGTRLVSVVSAILISGLFMRWLVDQVATVARAERAARDDAEAATEELLRTSDAKSEFLARMSHELRTPLNVILGFSDALRAGFAGALPPRQQSCVDDIADSGRDLLSLVDELLDVSKVEAGTIDLRMSHVDIGKAVIDAEALVRGRARLANVAIDIAVTDGPVFAEADALRVRQIAWNLLGNAVKFTPRGGRVSATVARVGNDVVVAVHDTGPGVEQKDQARIFQRFERGDSRCEGTGIGLALSRALIEAHGGELTLRSAPGAGSTFSFELPMSRALVDDAPAAEVDPPRADLDLDRPFLVPSSPANRALMVRVGQWFSRAAAALFAVLAVITPGPIELRMGIVVTSIAALSVGQLIGRSRQALSQAQTDLIGVFGIGAVSVGTLLAGSFGDLAPLAYGWNILAAGALLTRFHVLVKLSATIAAYGVVVLIDHPPGALQLWIGVCVLVVSHAQTIGWISTRLHELMSEGLSSRLAAEATRAQAEAVSAHKSDFLANTSHELCTPLNAIIGFAQVLDDGVTGPLEPKQAEYVTDILETGQHLLSLITDLLDLAKLEAGRLPTVRQPVVLAAVVQSVVQDHSAAALRHGIELCVDVSEDLPDLEGDPGHLHQVLGNLVSNSIKFTGVGGRVDVMSHLSEAEDRVLLSVRDTGIGISPELRNHVFEAFHQGTTPMPERARGGTGLGLTLAKWLVEIEGGTISVESTPNIGSTFTIELPIPGRPSRDPVLA
jgi:signal transduction histidine kinase